jgi:naphthalene 1,2-dioxygenase system ferredoxin subunit
MNPTPEWTDVAGVDDLFEGASIEVQPRGLEIALHCIDGVPYATDNVCTHGAGSLCEGYLEGFEIECPLHQGRFDIRNGQPRCAPVTEALRSYPVRIEGGRVYLALD